MLVLLAQHLPNGRANLTMVPTAQGQVVTVSEAIGFYFQREC